MLITLTKTHVGFIPADPATEEWCKKVKIGQGIHGRFKKVRNYAFLKKYFALLTVAYDNWDPGEISSQYGVPEKNFERFRADVTILSGYYETTIRLDGSVRIEPKSISFAKMDEDEFEKLYNATIDVLIKHVYKQGLDKDELDAIVEQYLSFV